MGAYRRQRLFRPQSEAGFRPSLLGDRPSRLASVGDRFQVVGNERSAAIDKQLGRRSAERRDEAPSPVSRRRRGSGPALDHGQGGRFGFGPCHGGQRDARFGEAGDHLAIRGAVVAGAQRIQIPSMSSPAPAQEFPLPGFSPVKRRATEVRLSSALPGLAPPRSALRAASASWAAATVRSTWQVPSGPDRWLTSLPCRLTARMESGAARGPAGGARSRRQRATGPAPLPEAGERSPVNRRESGTPDLEWAPCGGQGTRNGSTGVPGFRRTQAHGETPVPQRRVRAAGRPGIPGR